MNINDEFCVKIEKMVYGGSALAQIDGMAVFVENAAPDDKVRIKISKINKSFAQGEIIKIEEPSKYRVKPKCALSKICGSCDWQFLDYSEQLNQKKQIIEENLKRIANVDVEVDDIIPSPKIDEYRCKVQMPFAQTKVSKRILSGYYKKNSHDLINIKFCPMQPLIINEINEFLKEKAQNLGLSAYYEKTHLGLIKHVVYRISSDLSQILIIIVCNANYVDKKLQKLSCVLKEKYPQIVGICANFNTQRNNVILSNNFKNIIGDNFYIENLSGKKYKISDSSFFQVNPYCAELIFNEVKNIIKTMVNMPAILDAYSGVSSFGIWLSDIAKKVTCIEEVKSAVDDAKENIKLNNINNMQIINGDASKEFEKLIEAGEKFDVVIMDPPRKGSSEKALEYVSKLANKYIIYVSCNPSTLARDIKILKDKGFELKYVKGADMFPNTYHVETIAVLMRSQVLC